MVGHNGLDYGLPTGTEVVAPISGTVIEAVRSGDNGYGKYIKIENDKEGSLVAHLQSVDVNEGDKVVEGQHIGVSNNTGFSIGPHLHWGYYRLPRDRSNGFAGYIDQLPILEAGGSVDSFLGKPKEYWLQVEKDRTDLLKKEGELKTQVNEIGIQLVAEQGKSKSLADFLTNLAVVLNVPNKQEEIQKAIMELISGGDSIQKLTKEVETSKTQLLEAGKKDSEDQKTILTLTKQLGATTRDLATSQGQLKVLGEEYGLLLQMLGAPLWRFKIFRFLATFWWGQ